MSDKRRQALCLSLTMLAASIGIGRAGDTGNEDAPTQISGDYRVVITQMCVRTPYQPPPASGFDPNTHQLLADGETVTAIGSGLLRFAEDGTVQMLEGVQTEVSVNQAAPGKVPVAPPTQLACSGTYTLRQRKVALSVSCDVNTPQPGVTVRLGPLSFEGYIDSRQHSISLTDAGANIQTITVSVAGNPVQQRQRICTQYAMAVK
jgi:hypothetical protein